MNLLLTIIAIIMVVDSIFTLLNLTKVESILHSVFPKMDVRKLATIEGVVGIIILALKYGTKTIH